MEVINSPGTLICPRCGRSNDERAFFCSTCGAPIGSKTIRPSGFSGGGAPDNRYRSYEERGGYYYDALPLVSLLVTIFGFFVAGFIGPLFGVILGHVSLVRLNRRGDRTNRGMAIASLVIGYLMLLLGLLLFVTLGVLVGSALFNHGWNPGHWNYM